MRSGEEIQKALAKFVKRWRNYSGTERGGAQTFLNELIACYGADRLDVGAVFEDSHAANGIMDMYWPDVCIVEMKAPAKADQLASARQQALDYWHSSDNAKENRPAPPYVVLCAFQRFEVWEPGRFPSTPRADFTLDELPEGYERLLFLSGTDEEPLFGASYKELTTEAAAVVANLYGILLGRSAAAPETLRSFVLQIVWCLFAEDLGMIEGHPVQRIIEDLVRHTDRSSYTELGTLFDVLNDPNDYGRYGVLKGTRYVNGSLFVTPAKVHLEPDELKLLVTAAAFDWRKVDPTIFGSLMENILGHERRWELGAHYTHEIDIMKIVRPTIIEPWRERIEASKTVSEVSQTLADLCNFRVLDPACGCGNFLYIAYRELRSMEHELKKRIEDVARQTGVPAPNLNALPYYPLSNLHGIDIEPTSVLIARVTLWMGQRQMIDRFGAAEPALPLVDLSGIDAIDALSTPWPEVDCIIGNPPFLGSQHIRGARGDSYVDWLRSTFKVGVKDYCVYWYRRAHDHLVANQRAGLVGTNSISQNRARGVSLDYIVANNGIITDAISTQKWPGEAKVHVSLVNWIKAPSQAPEKFVLDGEEVTGITPELRTPERSTGEVPVLVANRRRSFQGPIPVGDGFIIDEVEAQGLLQRTDASYREVVRPYLIGDDITEDPGQQPRRWIIDFAQLPLEAAAKYPEALAIVRERVKPERSTNRRKSRRERWWLFGEQAVGMRRAIAGLERYIANVAQGKRYLVAWADKWTCPSNATNVFAFADDYAMGILASSTHEVWAWSRSSTLKGDLRYTPTSVFDTFPWPYPITGDQRETISLAANALIQRRYEISTANNIGLTDLYNQVDEGAYADLKVLHIKLDEAVVLAYGWPKGVAKDADEIVRRLLELNREIVAKKRDYDPFGSQDGSADNALFS